MISPIVVTCSSCGKKSKFRDAAHLKRVGTCSECGEVLQLKSRSASDDVDADTDEEQLPSLQVKRKSAKGSSTRSKSKRKPRRDEPINSTTVAVILGISAIAVVIVIGFVVGMSARDLGKIANVQPEGPNAAGRKVAGDEFAADISTASKAEQPYLIASKNFLKAVVARNYAAVYHELSSHARSSLRPEQFVTPREENHVPLPLIKDITGEQFAEWMQKMESARGIPQRFSTFHVHTIDPKILAGKGDPIETMFAIGAMPKEIPEAIRKASIRAQITIKYSDAQVADLAKLMNIPEEKVRAGQIFGDEDENDPDEQPYMNVKFVLVQEDGELKVGYFEFMPPSIMD